MNDHQQTIARSVETTEELIGILTAISIVSKRLAKNLAFMEQSRHEGRSTENGTASTGYTSTG